MLGLPPEEANEPATPIARVRMESRLGRDADRAVTCVLADESDGRCCVCFFGERVALPMVNLAERVVERRSLPEADAG